MYLTTRGAKNNARTRLDKDAALLTFSNTDEAFQQITTIHTNIWAPTYSSCGDKEQPPNIPGRIFIHKPSCMRLSCTKTVNFKEVLQIPNATGQPKEQTTLAPNRKPPSFGIHSVFTDVNLSVAMEQEATNRNTGENAGVHHGNPFSQYLQKSRRRNGKAANTDVQQRWSPSLRTALLSTS